MLLLFKIVIAIMLIFLALGLACAVWLVFRCEPGIGTRRAKHPAAADPYFFPIGDVPGFTRQQLDQLALASHARITADPLRRSLDISASASALRRNAAGGRRVPSWAPTGRNSPGDYR